MSQRYYNEDACKKLNPMLIKTVTPDVASKTDFDCTKASFSSAFVNYLGMDLIIIKSSSKDF